MTTAYELHVEQWKDCERCELSLCRTRVCLWRGPRDRPWKLPCDVVFVGQAPGKSEDLLGEPFVGPAGNLFDAILKMAVPEGISYAMTNLVACFPFEGGLPGRRRDVEPDDHQVKACAPRLQEFVKLADPSLIITVGTPARDWLDWRRKGYIKLHRDIPQVSVVHPSAVLKGFMTQTARDEAKKRMRLVIANAIEEFVGAADTEEGRWSAAKPAMQSTEWNDDDIPF